MEPLQSESDSLLSGEKNIMVTNPSLDQSMSVEDEKPVRERGLLSATSEEAGEYLSINELMRRQKTVLQGFLFQNTKFIKIRACNDFKCFAYIITTKFCSWPDSCAVGSCAKFLVKRFLYPEISRSDFEWNLMSFCETVPWWYQMVFGLSINSTENHLAMLMQICVILVWNHYIRIPYILPF